MTGLGVTRILDAIRQVDHQIRFRQASSSEMFAKAREVPQKRARLRLQAEELCP